MPVTAHCIDVGCGNMVVVLLPDGIVFVCDCNITDDDEDRVLLTLTVPSDVTASSTCS
jgi:hypothetical protein